MPLRARFEPATAAEIDALNLPPTALGMKAGVVPWGRSVPEVPEGAADRPAFLEAEPGKH